MWERHITNSIQMCLSTNDPNQRCRADLFTSLADLCCYVSICEVTWRLSLLLQTPRAADLRATVARMSEDRSFIFGRAPLLDLEALLRDGSHSDHGKEHQAPESQDGVWPVDPTLLDDAEGHFAAACHRSLVSAAARHPIAGGECRFLAAVLARAIFLPTAAWRRSSVASPALTAVIHRSQVCSSTLSLFSSAGSSSSSIAAVKDFILFGRACPELECAVRRCHLVESFFRSPRCGYPVERRFHDGVPREQVLAANTQLSRISAAGQR